MNRNLYRLIGILLALGVIAYILLRQPGEQSVNPAESERILALDSAAVDRIEIASPGSSLLTLVKRGAEWFIDKPISYKANASHAASLLSQASTLTATALVSDKPDKQQLFEVDSTGTTVSFHWGSSQAALVVGKQGPSYSEVYARPSGSDNVYLVDGALSSSVKRPLKEWRDKSIVTMPMESIRKVDFAYGDTTFSLMWRDSVWSVDAQPANDAAVNSFLRSLSGLETDEFIDTPPASLRPVASIAFQGLRLSVSQTKGSENYVIRTSASPQYFELRGWNANQILKRRKDFLKP